MGRIRALGNPSKMTNAGAAVRIALCCQRPAKNSSPRGGRNHPLRELGLCKIKRVLLFTHTQHLSAREQPTGSCSERRVFPFGGTEVYLEREEPVLERPRFTRLAPSPILFQFVGLFSPE